MKYEERKFALQVNMVNVKSTGLPSLSEKGDTSKIY